MEGKLLVLLLVAGASAQYVPRYQPRECNYKGHTYNVGQKFPAGDDCNMCTCESNGRVSCTEKTCFCDYKGRQYKVGQSFPSGDGCNTCTCGTDGRVTCTKRDCIKSCDYNGRKYKVGQSFPKGDGCNNCTCGSDGRVSCSDNKCPKEPEDVCSLPKVTGGCGGYHRRWWYNSKTNDCEHFTYGGCKGNGNNFKSKGDCLRKCRKGGYQH